VLRKIVGRWDSRTCLPPHPENDHNMNSGILRTIAAMLAATVVGVATLQAALIQRNVNERPNIVWFVVDDMSANFSCYGETAISTPHVDQLAQEGLRFTRAYATSPVCSTFRSAMITGMYQTSIGAHHHRSGRGEHRITLPDGVRPAPVLFQEAGYYTCMGSGLPDLDYRSQPFSSRTRNRLGKTDYNFDWNKTIYDSHDWSGRRKDQPFFMQVQLHGGKLRGASAAHYDAFDKQVKLDFSNVTNPESVQLPPYYPRDGVLLKDWSTYLDSVRITDRHVGLVMDRLKQEGLLENTLVVFFTDHGISHARGKQFLYDEGTHIPLVIRGPGIDGGVTRSDLVQHIDIAALSLAAAGIEIPQAMQGQDVLALDYKVKKAVFAARDRCGEAADRIRSVRTDRYLYIRNFYPQRPLLMPSGYKDGKLIVQRLRQLHAAAGLSELSQKLLFAPTRLPEELYDYRADRWQTTNLAADPGHAAALKQHRQRLERWIKESGDVGPETPEVYVLETEDQMKSTRNTAARETYRTNAELYKRWAREGK
jgi:arylsulfatase A-like enzyme